MGTPRRVAFTLLALALTCTVAGLLAEVAVRLAHPTPRVSIVRRTAARGWWTVDDVDLWVLDDDGPMRDLPCDGPTVVLAGDSVFYSTDTQRRLEHGLRERLPGVCVIDVSQSGFVPSQQLAAAKGVSAVHRVDLVVLGAWKSDLRFSRIGDDLVLAEMLSTDALGTPVGVVDLPDGLHRWLYAHSRAWELLSMTTATPAPDPRPEYQAYFDAFGQTEALGQRLVIVEAAELVDVPEKLRRRAEALASGAPVQGFLALQREAERRGVPYVQIGEVLADEDPEVVSSDLLHLRTAGHELLADRLAPIVRAELDRGRP